MVAERTYILLYGTVTGYKYIAQPEGLSYAFEPFSSAQCLFIAAFGEHFVALGIELFDIEQYKVGNGE